MASLLEKTATLIRANLHDLIDRALKANSLAVIDEYIRQVERNLRDLEEAAATVGGEAKTLHRRKDEYRAQATELDHQIDTLLQMGRDDLAEAAQLKYNSASRLADQYAEQWRKQQEEYERLLDVKMKLEARLMTIKQEREEVEAMLHLAKSKEITVEVMRSLDDLTGSRDSDVARMAESIRQRLDKASAASEMAASRLEAQMAEVIGKREIDVQLAERKKKLGLTE